MKLRVTRSDIDRIQIVLPDKRIMAKAAEELTAGIRMRTRSGLDVDGKPFARYAASTARQRARLGLSAGVVTLRRSGALLAGMSVHSPEAGRADIRFPDPFLNRLRRWLSTGTSHLPPRPFFGAGKLSSRALLRLRGATGLQSTRTGGRR